MPNYCSNNLTITADKATIDKLEAAFADGKFLAALRPEPDYEGYKDTEVRQRESGSVMPDWWEWRVANWGTKWDVGGEHAHMDRVSDTELYMSFDSAWSPPVAALQSRDDIQYLLHYCETGCDFCGTATGDSGVHGDETYTIENAPPHLVAEFALDEWREAMDDQ
jgi:hypothetical protein